MEKITMTVEGMSCEHCVQAVKQAVGALPGVADVAVDLQAKTVAITHDPARSGIEAIRAAIEDAGYDVLGQL